MRFAWAALVCAVAAAAPRGARADECDAQVAKLRASLDAIHPAPVLFAPSGILPPPAKHGRLVTENGIVLVLRGAGELHVGDLKPGEGRHLYVLADGATRIAELKSHTEKLLAGTDVRLLVVGIDVRTVTVELMTRLRDAIGSCDDAWQGFVEAARGDRARRWDTIRAGVGDGVARCGCRGVKLEPPLRWLPVDASALPAGVETIAQLIAALDRP
ncbi:MAG TPA: hypothetical protein VFF06_34925 [Polyangia bacterium]|nr:hypothetical protein [Polyangia bacterium]